MVGCVQIFYFIVFEFLARSIVQRGTVLTAAIANPDGKPDVMWNFTKFLVDREGSVVERFEPGVSPEQIAETLPSYLD